MKIFEYLYMGKLIISSAIDQVTYLPSSLIRIAHTEDDWIKKITETLHHLPTNKQKRHMMNFALRNNWHKKIDAVSNYIYTNSKRLK